MISIIIPVYNKGPYVADTIRSVLNQSYSDFELILVDDGSTDDSSEVISTFKDPRIRLISIENSGVSVARNTGINASKHPFVAFLDADDWWHESFLSEISALINDHPQRSVFGTGRSRVFNQHVERYRNEFLPEEGLVCKLDYLQIISKYDPPLNSSDAVVRKDLLKEAGMFKPGQKNYEDHDLWLRMCWNNPIIYKNLNLSFNRKMVANSASGGYYSPKDFLTYLDTISYVKERVDPERSEYLRKYYTKFILVSYIKYYHGYSPDDVQALTKKIDSIAPSYMTAIIQLANKLPAKGLYKCLRFVKKMFDKPKPI